MKFLKSGQIAIWVTTVGGVLIALVSGWFSFASGNSSALAEETNQRKAEDTEIKVNVATLKEAVSNTQKDVTEVKGDIKELLRRIPK